MWRTVTESSTLTFHGGFLLLSVATASVIASVTLIPRHPVTRFLSLAPVPLPRSDLLRDVPLVPAGPPGHDLGANPPAGASLLVGRMAAIVVIAAVSFHLLETPIRRGALAGWRSWVAVPWPWPPSPLVPSAGTHALRPGARRWTAAVGPARPVLAGVDRGLPVRPSGADPPRRGLDGRLTRRGDVPRRRPRRRPGGERGSHRAARWANRARCGCSGTRSPRASRARRRTPSTCCTVYRAMVDQYDPDVVVYLARADTLDTELDGSWGTSASPHSTGGPSSGSSRPSSVLGSPVAPRSSC